MTLPAARAMVQCGPAIPHRCLARLQSRKRPVLWNGGNPRCLAIGALLTARAVTSRHDTRWTTLAHRSTAALCRAAVTNDLPLKKGLEDSALELDPAFWEGAEDTEWCAVYINLARREDRKDPCTDLLLQRLDFASRGLAQQIRRIDAVDGQQLTLRSPALAQIVSDDALDRARHVARGQIHGWVHGSTCGPPVVHLWHARRRGAYTIVHSEGRLLHFDNHLTMGGIACAMSHRLALKAVAEHPTAKWGLILEDDILATIPDAEKVVAKTIAALPDDWQALFLGYHDDDGRPHPAIVGESKLEEIEVDAFMEKFQSWQAYYVPCLQAATSSEGV
eukprot:Skav205516  [mRNA]  locus=scaffold231:291874:296493:- [translate_table: standard]